MFLVDWRYCELFFVWPICLHLAHLKLTFDGVVACHFFFFRGNGTPYLCHLSKILSYSSCYMIILAEGVFSDSDVVYFIEGFELYSMVPSICPLETLHNSLSLKQVDDFLTSIAISNDPVLEMSPSSPGTVKTACTDCHCVMFTVHLFEPVLICLNPQLCPQRRLLWTLTLRQKFCPVHSHNPLARRRAHRRRVHQACSIYCIEALIKNNCTKPVELSFVFTSASYINTWEQEHYSSTSFSSAGGFFNHKTTIVLH